MKRKITVKLICALLIFIFAFNAVACEKKEEEPTFDENQRLEIVTENIKYSDTFIKSAHERYNKIAISIAESYLDMNLFESQKKLIDEEFNKTVLPMAYRIKIYESEFDTLLTSIEEYINLESTSKDFTVLFSLYEKCLYTLGSKRSGQIAYELSLKSIKSRADKALQKYEQYGNSWHLDDALRCSQLYEDLEKLGNEKFVNALSMSTFIASTTSAVSGKFEESAFLLSDAELLFILNRQGMIFKEQCPTAKEWTVFGSLISEMIPTMPNSLNSSVLYALKKDGYFMDAAKAMPELISFYAATAAAMKNDAAFSLEGTKEEKERAIIRAILASEEEMRKLDIALAAYAKTDSERLKNNVTQYTDKETLELFLNSHLTIDCDGLINSLKELLSSTDTSKSASDIVFSYLRGFSPYLAFTIFYQI